MSNESEKVSKTSSTNTEIEDIDGLEIEDIDSSTTQQKSIKGKSKKGKKADSKARTASAAVFFNENKSIAGFGNSMRAVFTSVRELVENSLDASEKRSTIPKINIRLRRLDKEELRKLMGTSISKSKDTRLDFIEISCKDNGVGVPRELIPQLFGTVLAGTKYGAQQTRGRFGLGSKMVLLYAMSTLDLPIQITTRPEGENKTYRVKLFINLEKNEPIIHEDQVYVDGDEEYFDDYGTEIKVSFTGSWNLAKLYVREYFKQLAIITPYADIRVSLPGDEVGTDDAHFYQRVVDDLPKPPEVVQVHPWGTDISTFRRELSHSTEDTLVEFLVNNFMGVSVNAAELFFKEVNVDGEKSPQDLTSQEIRRIVHDGFNSALKESKKKLRKRDRVFKFDDPEGDALSPLGANRLRKGLEKELAPEFVEAVTRTPKAYEGHPFIIEAAIGYGGGVGKAASSKGVTVVDNRVIYRFANRIPLIFGAGSDLITNVVNSINWSDYGLTRGTEPLAIAVSLVSTKIPFPETSKEYIDKVEEIGEEVKLTMSALGRKLKTFLGRRRRRQRESQRKSRFEKYAPDTVENLIKILEKEGIWNSATSVNKSRIKAALSSGVPRIDSSILPPGKPLYLAHIWGNSKTIRKLQENQIHEISTFFRTDNQKLAKLLSSTKSEIDLIKRRTINELDKANEVPNLDSNVILNSNVERRFHTKDSKTKSVQLSRLSKALPRRWIRNSYDYLVSPPDQLLKVQGLGLKLIEADRIKVIQNLYSSEVDVDILDELSNLLDSGTLGDASDLESLDSMVDFFGTDDPVISEEIQDTIQEEVRVKIKEKPKEEVKPEDLQLEISSFFPPLETLWEIDIFKKRKITSLIEFLVETSHPTNPLDEKVFGQYLIPEFKKNLSEFVLTNPEYAKIKINTTGQKWLDGYLRYAFTRRKISTVQEFINTNDSVLIEIGELQRTLFSTFINMILPIGGEIDSNKFNTSNSEQKIVMLALAGINNLEQFAIKPSKDILEDKKLHQYLELLIEESKDVLIEQLTMQNDLGSLQLLKEITPQIEDFLDQNNVQNTLDLLKNNLITDDKEIRSRINDSIFSLGRNFEGFTKTQNTILSASGVIVLDQFVLNPDYYLSQVPEKHAEGLLKILEILMSPISLISSNLITSINLLTDAGVTTLGKFLIWPSDELARITNMTEEWLNLVKQSFDVSDFNKSKLNEIKDINILEHLLNPEYVKIVRSWGIDTVAKAAQIKWGDNFPRELETWKKIADLNETVLSPIDDLSSISKLKSSKLKNLNAAIAELKNNGYSKILEYLRTSETTLLDTIKGKTKKTAIQEFIDELNNVNSNLINHEASIYKAIITYQTINRVKSPIVYLSDFDGREIDLLIIEGIKTLNQLVLLPTKEIASILKTTQKVVLEKIHNSKLQTKGTAIAISDGKSKLTPIISFEVEGTTHFSPDELNSLYSNGYDTIESLFYVADHRVFEVAGLNWDVVNQFKKLLRSPPVLITWKKTIKRKIEKPKTSIDENDLLENPEVSKEDAKSEETEVEKQKDEFEEIDYYETFSSKELDGLTKLNINRVIDFVLSDPDKLIKPLGWEKDLIVQRQKTIVLQEVGIGLADLGIFRADHVDHLSEMGLETIEDLYFTTSEDNWDSSILPYEPIKTIKGIVNLSLNNVVEELGDEFVDLLMKNGVETILDLLLTGDPILEQKTGLPAERFENLKFALDFGELIQVYDKSILFTPGLLYHQSNTLMQNGYTRILDLVLSKPSNIAKILDITTQEVKNLVKEITRSEVIKTEEDRGVQLKDLNVFTRTDLRSLAKSGIFDMNELDTLQEALYQITPDIFQGEEYLLEHVTNLQKACSIPLKKIGDINQSDVKLLADHNIFTLSDALMISFDDLPTNDPAVNEALNYVSASIQDLSPFISMARLPAQSAMEDGKNLEPLVDYWLNDGKKLHQRTMRNIRSLLSMPIRFTSFFKSLDIEDVEISEQSIADVLLEYAPEDHPSSILRMQLSEPGAIVNLLKEGSTPISLLDIDPIAFRALTRNEFLSVEKTLLIDEKILSNYTNQTQKYWKNIKDIFDPEVFAARIGDIGIPINFLPITNEDKAILDEKSIIYLDQVTVFSKAKGIIKELQEFMYSSPIFLSGSPGEREISENNDARSIVEAILVLRKNGASQQIIVETITLAWQAYSNNKLPIPKVILKESKKLGINTIQDLVSFVKYSDPSSINSKINNYSNLFMESALLLPLELKEMINIVTVNRSSTIIDALTNPMNTGKINDLRQVLREGNEIEVDLTSKLGLKIIQRIAKATYNRIADTNISLQDIISSPKTLLTFKSVDQKYLSDLRNELRLPLSRMHLENNEILTNENYRSTFNRLIDLIFNYSIIKRKQSDLAVEIDTLLNSDDLKVEKEAEISLEIQKSAETALGVSIPGFHELWVSTWQGAKMVNQLNTKPIVALREYIQKSHRSLLSIKNITLDESWQLKKIQLVTIADLLLTSEKKVREGTSIPRKRIVELQKLSTALLNSIEDEQDYSELKLRTLATDFDIDSLKISDIPAHYLSISSIHPVIKEIKISNDFKQFLQLPINQTNLIENISVNELKELFKLGILTILDLFMVPEKIIDTPKSLIKYQNRVKIIKQLDQTKLNLVSLKSINLPKSTHQLVSQSSNTEKFIQNVLTSKNQTLLSQLSIPLSYTELSKDHLEILSKKGLETLFDLIILPIEYISDLIDVENKTIIDFMKSINFDSLKEELTNVPLQVDDITNISKQGRELLKENNIFTLIDISSPIPSGFNRNDSKLLELAYQILDNDLSMLVGADIISYSDYKELENQNILSLRTSIKQRNDVENDLKKYLSSLKPNELFELTKKQRPLSDHELISNNDEKILLREGVFNFTILHNTPVERLIKLGFSEPKIKEILEIIKYDVKYLQRKTDEVNQVIKLQNLNSIFEVLTISENKVKLDKPIKVTKPNKISPIYEAGYPEIFIKSKIETIEEFTQSKSMVKLFSNKHEDVLKLVNFLNSHITRIPDIQNKWINKLENSSIERIWQYLSEDNQILADLCSSSVKRQEDIKSTIRIDTIIKSKKFKIPVSDKNIKENFEHLGLYSIQEITASGLLELYVQSNSEAYQQIIDYRQKINEEIWSFDGFWSLSNEKISHLSQFRNLSEYLQNTKEYEEDVFKKIIYSDKTTQQPIVDWIRDSFIIKELKAKNIDTIQKWVIEYYNGIITPADNSAKLLKGPLDLIPSIKTKEILKGYKSGINCISDIILTSEKSLSKKIGTTSSRVGTIRKEIPEIKLPAGNLLPLGLISSNLVEALRQLGFYSWSQILVGFTSNELKNFKGITSNSITALQEISKTSISKYMGLRSLGLDFTRKISKMGVKNIQDLLLLNNRVNDLISKKTSIDEFYKNLTKGNLNKATKQSEPALYLATGIIKADMEKLMKHGIENPVDIFMHYTDLSVGSELQVGIDKWKEIGDIEINILNIDEKVITKMLEAKINTISDLLILPNNMLKPLGMNNNQISQFRKDLLIDKSFFTKGTGAKTVAKKVAKKSVKKITAKKVVKKASKKVPKKVSKKKVAKKPGKKKVAKKSAKKTTKKKPVKKVAKKKSVKKPKKKGKK